MEISLPQLGITECLYIEVHGTYDSEQVFVGQTHEQFFHHALQFGQQDKGFAIEGYVITNA
jgi:hypothetical protein